MVERTTAKTFDEFEGIIEDVQVEPSNLDNDTSEQYHLFIKPTNVEIEGKTGFIHEWVRISPKCTDESIQEGSVLDKFIQQIEILDSATKKMTRHMDVMLSLKGKKYLFKKVKHGRSFEDKPAKEYWTPVKEL